MSKEDNIIVPRDNDATERIAAANQRVLTEMTAHLWSFLEANVAKWSNTILMAPVHIKDKNHGDAKTDEYYKALKTSWIKSPDCRCLTAFIGLIRNVRGWGGEA